MARDWVIEAAEGGGLGPVPTLPVDHQDMQFSGPRRCSKPVLSPAQRPQLLLRTAQLGRPSAELPAAIRLPDRPSCSPPFARDSGCQRCALAVLQITEIPHCRSPKIPRASSSATRARAATSTTTRRRPGRRRRGVRRPQVGVSRHGGRHGPRPRGARPSVDAGVDHCSGNVCTQDGPHDHDGWDPTTRPMQP